MKALLEAGLLNGDCLTVTGKTMAENLAEIAPPDVDGKIVRSLTTRSIRPAASRSCMVLWRPKARW